MEERTTSLRHRIPTEKRQECLKLFEQGYGLLTRSVSISASMQRETTPGHIEAVYPSNETAGWWRDPSPSIQGNGWERVIYCPGWIRDSSKDIFIEEFRILFF